MITITLSDEDERALAVALEVAGAHPDEMRRQGESAGVKPEWLMGLVMKLEAAGWSQ